MFGTRAVVVRQTGIGLIGEAESDDGISKVYLPNETPPPEFGVPRFADKFFMELAQYLNGALKYFSVPIIAEGTAFQQSIWHALSKIPYGATRSYKDIAELIGHRTASRAVGRACRENPIPILIPCHRVIGQNGRLTGYRGGFALKETLLKLESDQTILWRS